MFMENLSGRLYELLAFEIQAQFCSDDNNVSRSDGDTIASSSLATNTVK
jgi:hypothetical protein